MNSMHVHAATQPGSSAIDRDARIRVLVGRAQAGDELAFAALVRRVRAVVYRWAVVMTGDADDAEDVVQAVLIAMHRRLDGYDARARFTTWLYTVTRNAASDLRRRRQSVDRLRREARRDAAGSPRRPPAPIDRIAHARAAAAVRRFFEELPPRQRDVFDLVDLQGYGPAEAAEMLGLHPGTVRATLFKARRKLRRRILDERPELAEEYE